MRALATKRNSKEQRQEEAPAVITNPSKPCSGPQREEYPDQPQVWDHQGADQPSGSQSLELCVFADFLEEAAVSSLSMG